jgi:L-threonylcarbamoyladenylate synthase
MDIEKRLIEQACSFLKKGELVVIPTETVYGLAADATNDQAVAKIYQLKQRPQFNPLIIHIKSLGEAQQWALFPDLAKKLATVFWHSHPSPLTLVLNKKPYTSLSSLVTAGLDTVAVRVPFHPVALALLDEYKNPLAAPSANRSMSISPTTSFAVQRSLGLQTPYILEGGDCPVGLESTIIDLSGDQPVLLRPGATTIEMLEKVLGEPISPYQGSNLKAPGMMKRHYAPSLPLRINCLTANLGEALLGFGSDRSENATLNLSVSGNLVEAAANLFSMLNQLDNSALYSGIAVMPIPSTGIGIAINDRLQRGAYLPDLPYLDDELHQLT